MLAQDIITITHTAGVLRSITLLLYQKIHENLPGTPLGPQETWGNSRVLSGATGLGSGEAILLNANWYQAPGGIIRLSVLNDLAGVPLREVDGFSVRGALDSCLLRNEPACRHAIITVGPASCPKRRRGFSES